MASYFLEALYSIFPSDTFIGQKEQQDSDSITWDTYIPLHSSTVMEISSLGIQSGTQITNQRLPSITN